MENDMYWSLFCQISTPCIENISFAKSALSYGINNSQICKWTISRHASYWNAFLFLYFFLHPIEHEEETTVERGS